MAKKDERFMVIDFHTHCFVDSIAPKAMAALEAGCSVKGVHDGTTGGLKQHMAECGVDKSVVLPVATKPSQIKPINDWAKSSNDDHLLFFGAIHPDDEDFYGTVKELKQDGFKGVKLHPDYQDFFADEKRMLPLYEALRDTGLIVVFHSGMDIELQVPIHCTPLMLKNILEMVPGLTIVAAHMGAYSLWRDAEDLLLGKPLFIDTSYSYHILKIDNMVRMIKKHGAERVLFGTDSPWAKADKEIENILALDLPQSDKDKILYKNALTLLS